MRPRPGELPGVYQLGRYNHTAAEEGLDPHKHGRALEICYLVKGRQSYSVGGRTWRLTGGDIFITFPGEIHGTGGQPQEKGILYWLIIDLPGPRGAFLGMPRRDRVALGHAITAIRRRQFRGSWRMLDHLDTFTRLHNGPPNPLTPLRLTHCLAGFLLEVIECASHRSDRAVSRSLTPVLTHIADHLDRPLPIAELAGKVGLSEARFKVRFKDEIGLPPGEYVLRARIEEAERRLATGRESITRVAFDLGFSSSQYFATAFKRITGRRPSSTPGATPDPLDESLLD